MTDLTDKWKKGELPEGHYYIKTRIETNIDEYIQWYKDHGIPSGKSFSCFDVQEVLAPVPSYEEWQASENYIDYLKQCISIYENKEKQHTDDAIAYNELKAENDKLKSILKECSEALLSYGNFNVDYELYDKITGEIK